MIKQTNVPMGTYSVEFRTDWKHPYTGKNCHDHRIFWVNESMTQEELEQQIRYLSESG